MGFPSSFKNVEFCQQIRYLKGFSVDKLKADLGEWTPICKYAFIIHDECKDNNGNLKEPHIHLLMQFWNLNRQIAYLRTLVSCLARVSQYNA